MAQWPFRGQQADDFWDLQLKAYIDEQAAQAADAILDSPALTGNPTAPTPPVGDNDTSIATTAFVKGAFDGFAGTELGAADLNTVIAPGVYYQNDGTNATSARNYPVLGGGSTLEVLRNSRTADRVVQRFTPFPSRGAAPYFQEGIYIRAYRAGWSAWSFIPSQRVDNTAGRAIYTWDDTTNREQLIYGNTGVRLISGELLNGWTGNMRIMREGSVVSIFYYNMDPAAATDGTIWSVPVGFRPFTGDLELMKDSAGNLVYSGATAQLRRSLTSTKGPLGFVQVTYMTADPWPTTLPGTPVGSIPNL